jgi:Domain of unknown function (DUF4158)
MDLTAGFISMAAKVVAPCRLSSFLMVRLRRMGGSVVNPSQVELERYFFLDDADRLLAEKRRGEHHRLGFAVQLGRVRILGTFFLIHWMCRGRWWITWRCSWVWRTRRW